MPMPQRERDIQKSILDWLKLKRIFHFRANTGATSFGTGPKRRFVRFGEPGVPDIIAIRESAGIGQFVGVEVKGHDGALSLAQQNFSCRVLDAGGAYLVARSLEDVVKFFEPGHTN
jgi:hypothetical protein